MRRLFLTIARGTVGLTILTGWVLAGPAATGASGTLCPYLNPGDLPPLTDLPDLEDCQGIILLPHDRILDLPDSDGDGLSDHAELTIYRTDPTNPDTDGDGLSDGAEINTFGTNPLDWDTDGDGWSDWWEFRVGGTPLEEASPPNLAEPSVA